MLPSVCYIIIPSEVSTHFVQKSPWNKYNLVREHQNNTWYVSMCWARASQIFCNFFTASLGKTHIIKVFFSGRTTDPTLMANPFFFFLKSLIAWSGFDNFFFFFLIFGLKQQDFRGKEWFFALWSGGFSLSTPLVVPPLKKNTFLCLSSLRDTFFPKLREF